MVGGGGVVLGNYLTWRTNSSDLSLFSGSVELTLLPNLGKI